MKMWKKVFTFFLTVTMLLGLASSSVMAAEKEAYTYQITFYSGNIGNFNGSTGLNVTNEKGEKIDLTEDNVSVTADKMVVKGLNLGDVVSFNAQANVKLDATSKHYVQGVRLGGYDNDTVAASAFEVERDRDYVVAYGIAGNMTSYTIKYQDPNGNTLAPDEVYYGNVGDKPVVPYLYIDGWVPRYIGLTKTLSATASDNIMIFIYDEFEWPTASGGGTTITYEEIIINGGTVNLGTIGGGGAGGTGGNAAGAAGGTEDSEAAENDENIDTEDGEGVGEEDNSGILDLDDEEVPLSDIDAEKDNTGISLPIIACIALGAVAIGLLVFLAILLMKKQNHEKDEE